VYLLRISSYPERWRRLVRFVGLLAVATAIEGVGTLFWLLANPSEPESRVFLAYSLERWGLILLATFLISFAGYLLWAIRSRRESALALIEFFEDEKRAAGLLTFSTLIFVLMVGVHIGLLTNERTHAYYWQLLPLLAFITLVLAQAWIFLLVTLRQARIRILEAWFPIYKEDQAHYETIERRLWIVLVGVSLLYLFAQVNAWVRVPKAVELGDTTSYLEGAGLPLSDPAFFSERRPWGILLIYKLLGGSLAAIGFAQLAFSTFAWLFLAWVLIGSLRSSAGKLAGFIFTVGISLSPAVQAWNHAGMSESFSISMLIVILALFIEMLQRWNLWFFLAVIFFSLLWVSIHEVNLYLGLLMAIALFAMGLIRKHYRTFLFVALCISGMLAVNFHFSSLYALPRWALPLAEVITLRILPMPEYQEFFINKGMPVLPELMALSGRPAHSDNYAILNDPRLRPFSRWLFRDGRNVYANFLVAHPVYTLSMPLINIDEMLAADFSQLIPGYEPALPAVINEFFFPVRWFWVYLGVSVLLFAFVLWRQRREKSRAFWGIVLFFIFSIPYLYLAWHGDALGVARHASVANIQFHLGLWLLFIFSLDRSIAKAQR
jgi:hypothetical protein